MEEYYWKTEDMRRDNETQKTSLYIRLASLLNFTINYSSSFNDGSDTGVYETILLIGI